MDNYLYGADNYVFGTRVHKIDSKNRIAIPASMRSFLGQEFVISQGFGDYIALYPLHEWNSYLTKIRNSKLPTTRKEYIARRVSAGADRMTLDSQGRVVLSEKLQRYAGIFEDGEAEIIGNINHIEIWKVRAEEEYEESIGDLIDEVDESYQNEYEMLGFGG